jgi:hypothetical protein
MDALSRSPLDEAIDAFNRGGYFEAAEMFEYAGRDCSDELLVLAQSFNRVAAALHLRFERGGRQAAINLMSQAMAALDDLRPERAGLDIDGLCIELHAFTEEIRATPREPAAGIGGRAKMFLERRRAPKIRRARPG